MRMFLWKVSVTFQKLDSDEKKMTTTEMVATETVDFMAHLEDVRRVLLARWSNHPHSILINQLSPVNTGGHDGNDIVIVLPEED